MRPMLSILIFPILGPWGKECPNGRHWWYQTGRELLQAVYIQAICCGFVSILNLNFGFPNFGGRGAHMEMGISGVEQGVSDLLQAVYT